MRSKHHTHTYTQLIQQVQQALTAPGTYNTPHTYTQHMSSVPSTLGAHHHLSLNTNCPVHTRVITCDHKTPVCQHMIHTEIMKMSHTNVHSKEQVIWLPSSSIHDKIKLETPVIAAPRGSEYSVRMPRTSTVLESLLMNRSPLISLLLLPLQCGNYAHHTEMNPLLLPGALGAGIQSALVSIRLYHHEKERGGLPLVAKLPCTQVVPQLDTSADLSRLCQKENFCCI